ncbi:MAG: hypothetical protein ACYDC1_21500 [Limisphaerales bacterium]
MGASFLDTFGVRAGDAGGAFLDQLLPVLGPSPHPLSLTVLGLAAIWLGLCGFLARAQLRIGRQAGAEPRVRKTIR